MMNWPCALVLVTKSKRVCLSEKKNHPWPGAKEKRRRGGGESPIPGHVSSAMKASCKFSVPAEPEPNLEYLGL